MIDMNSSVPFTPEAQRETMQNALYGKDVQTVAFTPEMQHATMTHALYGADVTNGIPARQETHKQPQYSYEDLQAIEKARNYDAMIQNGSLVVNPPSVTGRTIPPMQQPATTNVSPDTRVNEKSDDELWNEIFGLANGTDGNANVSQQQQQVPREPIPQKNEMNLEQAIQTQVKDLYGVAAHNGVNGDEVLQFIQSLRMNDYVDLYKAIKGQQTQVQQPVQRYAQPTPARTVGNYNPSIAISGNGMPNKRAQGDPFGGIDRDTLKNYF
jgi:hypothetical protein